MPFTLPPPSRSPWRSLSSAARLSARAIGPVSPLLPGDRCYSQASRIPPPPGGEVDAGEGELLYPRRNFVFNLSRTKQDSRRRSRPGLVLDALPGRALALYAQPPQNRPNMMSLRNERPVLSLYTILARYLQATTAPAGVEWDALDPDQEYHFLEIDGFTSQKLPFLEIDRDTAIPSGESGPLFTVQELAFLEAQGYTSENVKQWAAFLVELEAPSTAKTFLLGHSTPPLFVILLFLRRKHIRQSTLGTLMQHARSRLQRERIGWSQLKTLVMRLLRHARVVWPESIPWISALFTMQVQLVLRHSIQMETKPPSDLTPFCNAFLAALSMPASIQPIVSARHQQSAQFEVLRFMANQSPPLIVSRIGFRATTRSQLAHPKTPSERDWALLKGPSWPPWKRKRTDMDEDKGYMYGASRASSIIHRMHEAGYGSLQWEQIAQLHAGWDTDLSPTIQTRTLMGGIQISDRHHGRLGQLLWAARVRATRTRREAWACFLAWEASVDRQSQHVYLAMFEKLHAHELQDPQDSPKDALSKEHEKAHVPLPGDMKELLPEPKSSIDLIYIAEPVPSIDQLYHRMKSKGVQATGRLLALLIETAPDFSIALELLQSPLVTKVHKDVPRLLDGSILDVQHAGSHQLPNHLVAAFIRCLCRFGRFSHAPNSEAFKATTAEHEKRFATDRNYHLEYAYSLLIHLRPHYRPAWTAYVSTVLFSPWGLPGNQHDVLPKSLLQYRILHKLFESMKEAGIDGDEEQLRLLCHCLRHVAHHASQRRDFEDARHVFRTGPHLIRGMFHDLVSANTDATSHAPQEPKTTIPPHVPGPAVLHAYVRALGVFEDFEGLYSFTQWITLHHVEVTARAHAQHSGGRALRRVLIAIRAGLDGMLGDGQSSAPPELVELAKSEVDGVEGWGGWPTDDEEALYKTGGIRR